MINSEIIENTIEKKVCFLKGKNIYLRPLLDLDSEGTYPQWFNDETICQGTSHFVFPYPRNKALDYIKYANTTDKDIILAIVLKRNDLHIGNTALLRINWVYRTADFAIILGEKQEWNKGYGLEAGTLLLRHAFLSLNLNRIGCATFSNNLGMQKLALALGMKKEGVRRRSAYKAGTYLDIIEYGILNEEFNQY